jgi:hypothetical protein
MVGKPQDRQMIRNKRATISNGGEPEWTEHMTLQENGNSTAVTIPSTACKIHDLAVGDGVAVEVYSNGIFIPLGGDDAE